MNNVLNEIEFNALISVLQRAPMLLAEQIAIKQIAEKLKPQPSTGEGLPEVQG